MLNKWTKLSALVASLLLSFSTLTPAAQAAENITLELGGYGNVFEPWALTEYHRLHPNITLHVTKRGMDAHHDYLTNAFMAQRTPDVVAIEVAYSSRFRSFPQYFEDLRSAPYNANAIKSRFLAWRWAQGVGTNGSVIGIPTDVGPVKIAYRIDLFKSHGLPTNRTQVGALWPTWDKFIEVGKRYNSKLTAAEKTSCRVKRVCYGFLDNASTIYNTMLSQGTTKYYEDDGSATGKLIYKTNPAVRSAFVKTAGALNAKIGVNLASNTPDWGAAMNKGTFAAILAPAWMLDYIKQYAPATKGKWDIADLPGGAASQGGSQLAIPKAAKNKQAAWDFINWYLHPNQQLTIFKKYGLFPSASSLYATSALKGYKDPFFNNAPIGQIFAKGADTLKPIFTGRKDRAIENIFGQALSRVALGKQTASTAWAQALSEIKNAVG